MVDIISVNYPWLTNGGHDQDNLSLHPVSGQINLIKINFANGWLSYVLLTGESIIKKVVGLPPALSTPL